MPKKMLLMDEFHLSVLVPRGLPKIEYDAIHREHSPRLGFDSRLVAIAL